MGDGVGTLAPIVDASSQSTSRPESPDLADQILGLLAPTPPPASPAQTSSQQSAAKQDLIAAAAVEGAVHTDHPSEQRSTSPEDDDDSFLRDVELDTNGTSEVCFRICLSESNLSVVFALELCS